jgi:hypothetical protein
MARLVLKPLRASSVSDTTTLNKASNGEIIIDDSTGKVLYKNTSGTILEGIIEESKSRYKQSPSLLANFAEGKFLDSRFSFSRSSVATYFNAAGRIAYAKNDEPRFTHDPKTGESLGLLIEPQPKTNYITSNQFHTNRHDEPVYPARIELENTIQGPDGSYGQAALVLSTSDIVQVQNIRAYTPITSSCQNWTYSVFVKQHSSRYCALGIDISLNSAYKAVFMIFDFTDKVLRQDSARPALGGTVTEMKNGWYRLSITIDNTINANIAHCFFFPAVNSSNAVTGMDIGTTAGTYVWGSQLETGNMLNSFIPSVETLSSRASTATYIDSETSLLKIAPANVGRPVFNPTTRVNRGLLIENAATNMLLQSNNFTDTVWPTAASSVIAASTTGPDGVAASASSLIEESSLKPHYISQAVSGLRKNGIYTLSIFMKAGKRGIIGVLMCDIPWSNGSDAGAIFNLWTGKMLKTYESNPAIKKVLRTDITPLANGWYRCSVTFRHLSNATSMWLQFNMYESASNVSPVYNGDGTSGVFMYGAQLEAGYADLISSGTITAISTDGLTLTLSSVLSTSTSTLYVGKYIEIGGVYRKITAFDTAALAVTISEAYADGAVTAGVAFTINQVNGFVTSYIPTTTAQATRSADVASYPTATRAAETFSLPSNAFLDLYDTSKGGTLVVDMRPLALPLRSTGGGNAISSGIKIGGTGTGVDMRFIADGSNPYADAFYTSNATAVFDSGNFNLTAANQLVRRAMTHGNGNIGEAINGNEIDYGTGATTTFSVEKINQLYVFGTGENIYGNASFGMIFGKMIYIPDLLTANERKIITSV